MSNITMSTFKCCDKYFGTDYEAYKTHESIHIREYYEHMATMLENLKPNACNCGAVDYYNPSTGVHFDNQGHRMKSSGAWCHWCKSGYLCGRTESCRFVYATHDSEGQKLDLPLSCCMKCAIPHN